VEGNMARIFAITINGEENKDALVDNSKASQCMVSGNLWAQCKRKDEGDRKPVETWRNSKGC
jgi:hypothetical protein